MAKIIIDGKAYDTLPHTEVVSVQDGDKIRAFVIGAPTTAEVKKSMWEIKLS